MARYSVPLKDMRFVLEALGYEDKLGSFDAFEMYDLDTAMQVLEAMAAVAEDKLLPLNRKGDVEGLKFNPETGDVTLPDGFAEAYKSLCEVGMIGLSAPEEFGGGGAPQALNVLASEMMTAANKGFSMCPGLSVGLMHALEAHATQEQKEKYLTKLITGEWTGTMCLTEPQCGTDLGLISTKAEPLDDGSYKLTGTKIWITFGDHNLADNILHLVLARLPDAPEGIRGISAFIVPKFMDDGSRNPVFCTGLEEKMGIHVSPTCVMSLDGAIGYMVGDPNKGMRSMFTMMNMARLSVGMEGVALGEIAYQTALDFCKERRQGRSLDKSKNDTSASADNILVHPDVRRLLLNIKATNEALRGLGVWIGIEQDISLQHPDEAKRQESDDLVALLTPLIKSYGSERGFQNISDAMQACGGAGYTVDWDIEQYLRDERIAMIYEGTNHIQALDLVGRKLPMKGGRLLMTFQQRVQACLDECAEIEELAPLVAPFQKAVGRLMQATQTVASQGMQDPEFAASVASNYLNLFSLVTLGFIWLEMAKHAVTKDDALSATKLKTAHYFMQMVLPETGLYAKLVGVGKDPTMAFDVEEF
ncbi:acyl-CoA dehydrogenase C-terminal domain-containing protein [Bradymonas sediminis]|uniref:3-methylmercaptopropionyl-CoA dehydrogenase n=1 Tax=Bradymonas sediminis TaxID=1548548 RepID=A0A2Z4FGV8_9DELT|nr:acyl-CoA dehydrogenase C-terminal domain-containing protein [Bradymonas sediminis]AWV87955.1 acyl-CoA dehydrogenase [Bradymonas sediminis]TDP62975.1 alkylation response protein AidB-like acyl-CoA dehydrogenase [Bradymonas sediminis]